TGLFGAARAFPLDDPGWQCCCECRGIQPGGFLVLPMACAITAVVGAGVGRCGVALLRLLRTAAQNGVSHLSESVVHVHGGAVPFYLAALQTVGRDSHSSGG